VKGDLESTRVDPYHDDPDDMPMAFEEWREGAWKEGPRILSNRR
jgi:hypothetical protein